MVAGIDKLDPPGGNAGAANGGGGGDPIVPSVTGGSAGDTATGGTSGSASGGSAGDPNTQSGGTGPGTAGHGGTGVNEAGSGGSFNAGGAAGDSGSGGSAGSSQCPANSELAWALKEGHAGSPLKVELPLGSSEPTDLKVELHGAPPWVKASVATKQGFTLTTDGAVPFDAHLLQAFEARLVHKQDPGCKTTVRIKPSVTNVLRAPLDYQALPNSISYAAWHAQSESFYLLDSTHGRLYVLDTRQSPPSVGAPIALPSAEKVAPLALALSPNRVHVIIDNHVHRLDLSGKPVGDPIAISDPAPSGIPSLAYADGYLLIGDEYDVDSGNFGPLRVLPDGSNSLLPADTFTYDIVVGLTSDGTSFGFKIPSGDNFALVRLKPGENIADWAATSCTVPVAVTSFGFESDMMAWVLRPSHEYTMSYIPIDQGCEAQDATVIGSDNTYELVGVSKKHALVATKAYPTDPAKLDFALFDLTTGKEVAERLIGQNITQNTFKYVMGSLKYALVVTTSRPLLLQL